MPCANFNVGVMIRLILWRNFASLVSVRLILWSKYASLKTIIHRLVIGAAYIMLEDRTKFEKLLWQKLGFGSKMMRL